jgi:hypothetical protein
MNLKPNEEIQVSALSAAVVYGVWQLHAPNLADVKAAPAGNSNVQSSMKSSVWTAAVVSAGLAILAKSPTIFIVGSVMNVAEYWHYAHANQTNPATGKIDPNAVAGS